MEFASIISVDSAFNRLFQCGIFTKLIYDEDNVKVEEERVDSADTSITKIIRCKQGDNTFPWYIMQVSETIFVSWESKTKDIKNKTINYRQKRVKGYGNTSNKIWEPSYFNQNLMSEQTNWQAFWGFNRRRRYKICLFSKLHLKCSEVLLIFESLKHRE
jgi:hypothetical protein